MEEKNRSELEDNSDTENLIYEKETKPFMEEGDSSDEIVLKFDNGKKLFVSENFLSYASPVFQAMFRQDFREKETREVALKEKIFEDFHEFLLCLHPRIRKPVDRNNMLKIVSLANEYQVESLICECKQRIEEALLLETQSAYNENLRQKTRNYKEALACLTILKTAEENGFDDIISFAVSAIANFGYEVFTGTESSLLLGVSIEKRLPAEEPIFKFSRALVISGKPQTTSVSYRLQNAKLPVAASVGLFGNPATTTCSSQFSFGSQAVTQSPGKQKKSLDVPANVSSSAPVEAPALKETELRTKCRILYNSLSSDTKNKILLERLKKCDGNRFSLA